VADRLISAIRTVRLGATRSTSSLLVTARTELDSHADTCVVGRNALVTHDFDRPVNVTGYDSSLGTVNNCKTVSAAIGYDDPETGEVVVLLIHQSIYIPTLEHNLLCPMQLRMNDVKISEVPKFLTKKPQL
jgi:hypothetical protein